MRRILSRRPSPAIILAIVALVAALAGTAVAGGGFVTKKKFNKFKSQTNTQISTLSTQTSAAVKGPIRYVTQTVSVPDAPATPVQATASCPAGTKVLGGGAQTSVNSTSAFIDETGPAGQTGWEGKFDNGTGAPYTGTVTAICATSS
jgi:hypothetical protein